MSQLTKLQLEHNLSDDPWNHKAKRWERESENNDKEGGKYERN